RREIKAALRSLKMYPLLDGWRGRAKADTDAAIETILAICAYAEARRDTLLELEINPLALLAEGQGTCALDAVMRFTEQE
ncbi:MAG: CoA-binding protein, partial [Gammaproteobacteria bacterium]|nr:CoA-binding protein [Gammaproteobacteria bacterium]